jgi:hypothetical protein
VCELDKEGLPLDTVTFSMVAEEFGIGSTTVKEIYYELKKWPTVMKTSILGIKPPRTSGKI